MSTHTTASEAGASTPPLRENLYRVVQPGLELVRADGDAMPTLVGHFAVFDQWTEINSAFEGHFMERFSPGAFAKTIRDGRDRMRVLFQHGQDNTFGDKPLGPIGSLEEDPTGVRYEVPLLDTSYNRDLVEMLKANVLGASFRFKVMQESFVSKPKASRANPQGLPERTVTEAQVREFGPVTFPAYAGATAGVRSQTDRWYLERLINEPDILRDLVAAREESEPVVTSTVFIDGAKVADVIRDAAAAEFPDLEPEPSEATTPPPSTEPEPSAAATRTRAPRAGIYPYRKEKPSWLL